MHNYEKLKVYNNALTLTEEIYNYSRSFPSEERFGLTSQLRRAAVSVPSNIAEGCGRSTNKDTAHFLSIAVGSSFEVDTQLRLAQIFGYGDCHQLTRKTKSIGMQIVALRNFILSKDLETKKSNSTQ